MSEPFADVTLPTTDTEPATEAGRELAAKAKREAWSNWEWLVRQTIPAIEREAAERASGGLDAGATVNGATRGERCPATHNAAGWCSRDAGHPGAHESRHPRGRGLGAWWNERYARLTGGQDDE